MTVTNKAIFVLLSVCTMGDVASAKRSLRARDLQATCAVPCQQTSDCYDPNNLAGLDQTCGNLACNAGVCEFNAWNDAGVCGTGNFLTCGGNDALCTKGPRGLNYQATCTGWENNECVYSWCPGDSAGPPVVVPVPPPVVAPVAAPTPTCAVPCQQASDCNDPSNVAGLDQACGNLACNAGLCEFNAWNDAGVCGTGNFLTCGGNDALCTKGPSGLGYQATCTGFGNNECIYQWCPTPDATSAPATESPTSTPTGSPIMVSTATPTNAPIPTATLAPVTEAPVVAPTAETTGSPTGSTTTAPIPAATLAPTTTAPTISPTLSPTESPTLTPTASPTASPTLAPTEAPTSSPTASPTEATISIRKTDLVPLNMPDGNPFDDTLQITAPVSAISIQAGWWVDAIETTWADGTRSKHGGNGGAFKKLSLTLNEYFTSATICIQGNYVDFVRFGTITGRSIEGGRRIGQCSTFDAQAGEAIAGFFGKKRGYIDQLGVIFGPAPAFVPAQWSNVINLPLVPVAAANLEDGRILTWSAYGRYEFGGSRGRTQTLIFDPATGQSTELLVQNTNHDMFCPGTAMLPDGSVMITGGSNSEAVTFYNSLSNTWTKGNRMIIPRGYHGMTVLADGSVFTVGGSWSGGSGNKVGEVWNINTGNWEQKSGIRPEPLMTDSQDYHMMLFTAPNGKVFHAGPSRRMHWLDVNGSGSITNSLVRSSLEAMTGNAVMYDTGKILVLGGSRRHDAGAATKEANVIDINGDIGDESVTRVGDMAYARTHCSAVVLPTGEVVVVGGQEVAKVFSDDLSVYTAEIWNPDTGRFSSLQNMRIPRNYHSVGILMKDGRIWVGGGGLCGNCNTNHPDAEIFTPPYLLGDNGSEVTRPRIVSSPQNVKPGDTMIVQVDSFAGHTFALVRLSAVTHALNNDSRRIPLEVISRSDGSFNLSVPSNPAIALPGKYFLFAMNGDGVPSVATILTISL